MGRLSRRTTGSTRSGVSRIRRPAITSPTPKAQPSAKGTPVVIAIMGLTGAGKSNFIKAVTGHDPGTSDSLTSSSQGVIEIPYLDPFRKLNFLFIDTPGFDPTNNDDFKVLQQIARWLREKYRGGLKLSGILYLHRITDNRMPRSSVENLNLFEDICGSEAFSIVGLVTTHWDEANRFDSLEECNKREAELSNSFWKLLIERGSKMHRFDNTSLAAWNIINSLSFEKKPLQIQKQMVDEDMPLEATTAGRRVLSWIWVLVSALKAWLNRARAALASRRSSETSMLNDNASSMASPTSVGTGLEQLSPMAPDFLPTRPQPL
ncbi:hypothetical protein NP233_g12896 [Leucocoprinus birnbaumii]|uniref:G domain-containing protein n=1 Tax=Leucocoprinus birnbaumii TaxID=56174 RepID=A0AAD5YK03_9AGAR|nr:hypothetical protein NP233_g12896 [Leucocoprinus birnbaumii]